MLVSVAFPFADFRTFLPDEGGRLSRPAWPLVRPDKDFIRSSGPIRRRRKGGDAGWAAEEAYTDVSEVVRLPPHLGRLPPAASIVDGTIECAFRRYLSDGRAARVEIGFSLDIDRASALAPIDGLTLLRSVLSLRVKVGARRSPRQATQLVNAGDPLAKHFLLATTRHQMAPQACPQSWWLSPGSPVLVVEYDRNPIFPAHTHHLIHVPVANCSLSHAWVELSGLRCSVWFIAAPEAEPEPMRRLRIHLIRLHTEQECLKNVLIRLKQGGGRDLAVNTLNADLIEQYLNDSIRVLRKTKRRGLCQQPLLEAARQALGISFEGDLTSLESARKQVVAKIKSFVQQARNTATVINQIQGSLVMTTIQLGDVAVSGPFNLVTAGNIQGSFNRSTDARHGDALRQRLQILTIAVTKLAEQLPHHEAESVTGQLATLTSEAASPDPRPERYAPAAQGIIAVAQSIADMAASIATAVSDVLAILGA
jgi:hypothetical protein